MNHTEIICPSCGEIFILRSSDKMHNPKYCPICTKQYIDQKTKARKEKEDAEWRLKKQEEVLQFEENLKTRNVVSLKEMEELLGDRVLYIIGNGFDMLHGVKSSYYDFSKTLGRKSLIKNYLEYYLKADDLWADFEGALGKINIEAMCNSLVIDTLLEAMGAYDEDAGAAEVYGAAEMAAEPIIAMSTDLMERFQKWIYSLSTNTDDRPFQNLINQGKVFDFNYTEFIESLYGVDENDICYIHGCRKKKHGKKRTELVLGHIPGANDPAYEFDDNYAGIGKLNEHMQLIYDVQQITMGIISRADESLTKKCDEIIKNHQSFFEELTKINQVVVIGHALYPVDWDYYSEIIKYNEEKECIKWFFSCYGNGDLERVDNFTKHFGIKKEQVAIFRTDKISVKLLPGTEKIKPKTNRNSQKVLSESENRKWKIISEGKKICIIDKKSKVCVCSRIFSTHMSGAVFDKNGRVLLLVARGLYAGVFLFRLMDDTWRYICELEGIPNQGVITKRLRKIMLKEDQIVFIYNSRIRKYDVDNGQLVYNQPSRRAFEQEYEGEDLTEKFRRIYKTGFY